MNTEQQKVFKEVAEAILRYSTSSNASPSEILALSMTIATHIIFTVVQTLAKVSGDSFDDVLEKTLNDLRITVKMEKEQIERGFNNEN